MLVNSIYSWKILGECRIRLCICIFFLLVFLFEAKFSYAQSNTTLWYNRPAEFFEEALVLGNGRTGATVFGGVQSDQIYLNDATLWSGEPVNPFMNPEAYQNIQAIRDALNNENYQLAEQLNKKIQGKFSESFAPLGTFFLEFENQDKYDNYYRELDISKAIAKVRYDVDGVTFTREYFVSHPDKIMVIKLSSGKKGSLNFSVKFQSLLKYTTAAKESVLMADGYAPYHAAPDYWRETDPVQFDENRGTRFSAYFKIENTGGQVKVSDSTINVTNADEATLLISIATSFNGFDKDPVKNGLDNKALANNQLKNVSSKSYKSIKEIHLQDYQTFFNRVKLDLNERKIPDLPTDERLKKYTQGVTTKTSKYFISSMADIC
jgi:alpha-L-fucosidase 2